MVNEINEVNVEEEMMAPDDFGMNSGIADELNSLSVQDIQNQSFLNYKIPPKLIKFMNMDNVAESLNEEQLDEIANIVYNSYEIDKESRSEWLVFILIQLLFLKLSKTIK
jgi:hypothetical protein